MKKMLILVMIFSSICRLFSSENEAIAFIDHELISLNSQGKTLKQLIEQNDDESLAFFSSMRVKTQKNLNDNSALLRELLETSHNGIKRKDRMKNACRGGANLWLVATMASGVTLLGGLIADLETETIGIMAFTTLGALFCTVGCMMPMRDCANAYQADAKRARKINSILHRLARQEANSERSTDDDMV